MDEPVRIVSLCPSMTESLIDFGLAEKLVGVTKFCIHPATVVRRLPTVGGTKNPDIEAIRAARPDLIFMNAEENRAEDHAVLAAEFLVDVSEPRRVRDIPAHLRHIGAVTGRTAIAETRAVELESALSTLTQARKPPFTFSYMIWRDPWMCVGGDTYVSDLFALAGGANVYADDVERYPTTTLAALGERAPDFVFLSDEPFPFSQRHAPEVRAAVPGAKVEIVSGDDCCWHGVRSIRGVQAMLRLAAREI